MLERFSKGMMLLALLGAFARPASATIPFTLHESYRGAREQSMGGAFTAVADDEEAIFINPAGLAGIPRVRLSLLTVDTEVSSEMIANISKDADAFSNFSASSINALMGQNVYAHTQFTPSVVMPHFGVSLLFDTQVAMNLRNQVLPDVALGYQYTNGVQIAGGFSVLGKKSKNDDLRVGVAFKALWRRGGYNKIPVVKLLSLNQDSLNDMAGSFGLGYGADIGTQYIHEINDRLSASVGATMLDVTNTTFASIADPIEQSFNLGGALTYDLKRLKIIMAYDQRHILTETDWRKRSHFGMEFQLPLVSVNWGLNQSYLTYGASVDLRVVKITAVSYAEEEGAIYGLDSDRRYLLRATLKFGY